MARSAPGSASPSSRPVTVIPAWLLVLYRHPLTALASLLILPLIVACLWLSVEHERQWREQEGHDLLVAARLVGRIIDEEFSRTRQIEQAIAARPEFVRAVKRADRQALSGLLTTLLDVTPMIDRVVVTDTAGAVLAEAAAASRDPAEPSPVRDPLLLAAQASVSGVSLRDRASGEKVVGVLSPIVDGQTVLGSVQVQYRLQEIARWLQKVRVEPAGFVYVVDRQGYLATYPFQLIPGKPKNVSTWATVTAQASAQGELIRFTDGPRGRAWTAAVVLLEPYGWRVIAQQPDAEMLRPLRTLVWSFTGLVLVLAALLSLLIIRWAHVQRETFELLAKQSRLLKQQQQERLRAIIDRKKREGRGPRP